MSYARDKQTYNTYACYKVDRTSTLFMELNQELSIQPGDYIIELSDENLRGFLIMDNASFNERFEMQKDES